MGSKIPGLVGAGVALTLSAVLAGCSEQVEPQAISDQEREHLTGLVERSSWIENAVCNVEVFRQEGQTTYGWAECTNTLSIEDGQVEQGSSTPFRAEGETIAVPGDGAQYAQDVRELFPADLVSTIEQYSGMSSASAASQ